MRSKIMEYLKLNSARKILKVIKSNNGLFTWYNIVKRVDQMEDTERIPPTYEVLKELTRLGLIRVEDSAEGNSAKYSITNSGLSFLTNEEIENS
jgi:Fe2+ or Zn2+ uptake regulation protein